MPRQARAFFPAGEDEGLLDDEEPTPLVEFGRRPRTVTTEGQRGDKPKKPARKAARRPRRGK
jgi:hypothetical protein